MIGRRPEPVPGVEPGRWRVVRARGLGEHWPNWLPRWYVERDGCHGSKWFHTWREAQDYADRMARTRQVVLPRPQLNKDGKIEFDFTEWAGLDYEPALGDKAVYELRTGPGPRFGERDVLIPREHWRPLAAALWALAEQEESCEK